MPKREAALLLADILEAIDKVESYTKDMSYEEFIADRKTVDAVVRNFETLQSKLSEIQP